MRIQSTSPCTLSSCESLWQFPSVQEEASLWKHFNNCICGKPTFEKSTSSLDLRNPLSTPSLVGQWAPWCHLQPLRQPPLWKARPKGRGSESQGRVWWDTPCPSWPGGNVNRPHLGGHSCSDLGLRCLCCVPGRASQRDEDRVDLSKVQGYTSVKILRNRFKHRKFIVLVAFPVIVWRLWESRTS